MIRICLSLTNICLTGEEALIYAKFCDSIGISNFPLETDQIFWAMLDVFSKGRYRQYALASKAVTSKPKQSTGHYQPQSDLCSRRALKPQ